MISKGRRPASTGSNSVPPQLHRKDSLSAQPKVTLERVIGTTAGQWIHPEHTPCLINPTRIPQPHTAPATADIHGAHVWHNGGVAINHQNNTVAYIAGSVVVIYSPRQHLQLQPLIGRPGHPLTCIHVSHSGQYLAAGEGGTHPAILIWDVNTGLLISTLMGHTCHIRNIRWLPGDETLVSLGDQHDKQMIVWDWKKEKPAQQAYKTTLTAAVHALDISFDGTYIVTVGDSHICYWYIQRTPSTLDAPAGIIMETVHAKLGMYQTSVFVAVRCGQSGSTTGHTFVLTADGVLCSFSIQTNPETPASSSRPPWEMDRWLNARLAVGYSLSLDRHMLSMSGTDGKVRLFDSELLAHIATLPFPPPLQGKMEDKKSGNTKIVPKAGFYPTALTTAFLHDRTKLLVVYADRTMIIWDIHKAKAGNKEQGIVPFRSFQYHYDAIWDVGIVPSPINPDGREDEEEPRDQGAYPAGTIVTCSSDNSIRFWMTDIAYHTNRKKTMPSPTSSATWSDELLQCIYVADEKDLTSSAPPATSPISVAPAAGDIRCLRLLPSSTTSRVDDGYVASGDRQGNLRIHSTKDGKSTFFLQAHDDEIRSIDFAGPSRPLLASGSRDCLIHMYDVTDPAHASIVSLPPAHTECITAVRFAASGNKLMTCSQDGSLVIRQVSEDGKSAKQSNKCVLRAGLNDLCIHPSQKWSVSCGEDGYLRVWDVKNGRESRSYKADVLGSAQPIRVCVDPSGLYLATASTDHYIRIHDFFSGTCLARFYGHAQLITGIRFDTRCTHLITTSVDGCIMIWKLVDQFTRAMKERLAENQKTKAPKPARSPLDYLGQSFVGLDALKAAAPPSALAVAVTANADVDVDDEDTSPSQDEMKKPKIAGILPDWARTNALPTSILPTTPPATSTSPTSTRVIRSASDNAIAKPILPAITTPAQQKSLQPTQTGDKQPLSARDPKNKWQQRLPQDGYKIHSELDQDGISIKPDGEAKRHYGTETSSISPTPDWDASNLGASLKIANDLEETDSVVLDYDEDTDEHTIAYEDGESQSTTIQQILVEKSDDHLMRQSISSAFLSQLKANQAISRGASPTPPTPIKPHINTEPSPKILRDSISVDDIISPMISPTSDAYLIGQDRTTKEVAQIRQQMVDMGLTDEKKEQHVEKKEQHIEKESVIQPIENKSKVVTPEVITPRGHHASGPRGTAPASEDEDVNLSDLVQIPAPSSSTHASELQPGLAKPSTLASRVPINQTPASSMMIPPSSTSLHPPQTSYLHPPSTASRLVSQSLSTHPQHYRSVLDRLRQSFNTTMALWEEVRTAQQQVHASRPATAIPSTDGNTEIVQDDVDIDHLVSSYEQQMVGMRDLIEASLSSHHRTTRPMTDTVIRNDGTAPDVTSRPTTQMHWNGMGMGMSMHPSLAASSVAPFEMSASFADLVAERVLAKMNSTRQ